MTSPFIKGNFNGNAPTTQNFQSAFNTWKDDFQKSDLNTSVDWSIKNGGVLPDLTLTINPFSAIANVDGTGGISDITISLAVDPGYKGPSLNQLVWSQGLYINYSVPSGSRLDPPANTLDSYLFNSNGSLSGGSGPFGQAPAPLPTPPANSNDVTLDIGANPADTAWADPIYPFQTADKSFFDAPQGLWPDASFRGIALLSTVSETTNAMGKVTAGTLTVYDGVSYGFDLSVVPEPDTWLMLIVGFGSVGLSALRRRSAHRRLRPTFASA
jgi:hypothetical protein